MKLKCTYSLCGLSGLCDTVLCTTSVMCPNILSCDTVIISFRVILYYYCGIFIVLAGRSLLIVI